MNPHFPILLVKGDDEDVSFAKRAFREADLQNPLRVVRDGEQSIAYLKGEGKFFDRERYPFPMLIIMGFKIPRLSGLDVLKWIRTRAGLEELPVVMLSNLAMSSEMEIEEARKLGMTAHLTRLPDSREFQHVYKIAVDQWNLLDTRGHPKPARKWSIRTLTQSAKPCAVGKYDRAFREFCARAT